MAEFNHFYKANDKSSIIDYLFYFASILLAAAVFSYLIFNLKVQLQIQRIQEVEDKFLSLGKGESQAYKKRVFDYKKKIDDFATILSSHKITSNIFSFIEEKTLNDVWFSNFNMQENTDEIILSGEARDMIVLSQQVKIFEESRNYVKSVDILDSRINSAGRVSFVLNLFLDNKIFNYQEFSSRILDGAHENNL